MRKRSGSRGKGKGIGAEEGKETGTEGGGNGGGSGGGSAAPSCADVEVSAATARRGKHERAPSKSDGRRARYGAGEGGIRGGGGGAGGGEDSENGGDFDGVVAMLQEFQEELFFRTIIMYL